MRFFNYLFFSFLLLGNAKAQHNHFIYIQTENKQAFYVKLNERIYSSSASGYAIIPKLVTGAYQLSIGFPKNEWPSQDIDIKLNDKDEGFLLKNFETKGWSLFNMQTMDVIAGTAATTTTAPLPIQKTDAFSNTLAGVTNTASIGQQEPKDSTTIPDSAKALLKEKIKNENPVALAPATQVGQVFSVLDNAGRSVIYTVDNGKGIDSVRVFIPYEKKDDGMNISSTVSLDSIIKRDSTENALGEANTVQANKNEYKVTIINPACKSTATQDDFLKLRKKMAAAENDEDMLAVARKGLKLKCFTTDQVKNLSLLFLSDYGKYNLYDAAYDRVTDIGDFKSLQSQLSEEYYINRFKAMLR